MKSSAPGLEEMMCSRSAKDYFDCCESRTVDGLKVIWKIFGKHFYNYVLIRQVLHLE